MIVFFFYVSFNMALCFTGHKSQREELDSILFIFEVSIPESGICLLWVNKWPNVSVSFISRLFWDLLFPTRFIVGTEQNPGTLGIVAM